MNYRYSMLDSAQRCFQKYKHVYVDKVSYADMGIPESGDMHFGTAMHTALHAMLEGDDAQAVFKLFWDGEKEADVKYGQFGWDAYSEMGPAFIERFSRLHAKKYQPLHMEKTLIAMYGGIMFEGTPDFVGHVNGVMSLVDFKTSRTAYDAAKLICNPQMYLYAFMAEMQYGIKIEQLIYTVFVKHPALRIQTLALPLDRNLMSLHLENLAAQAVDLSKRWNYPKNTASCMQGSFKCEFFSRCWPSSVEEPTPTT